MHRYNQIMKHIKVTPEIQDRIMEHIHQLDLNETKPKPATPFPFGKCLLIGACFVILVLGGFFAFNKRDSLSELYQQVVSHSIEYRSVKELSRAVGFNVRQVQKLPFEAEKIRFSSYRKKTAQIDYTGKDQAVSFRMSAGKKDVSGDHNQYTSVKDIPSEDMNVTIKGDQDQYVLAVWQVRGYSYSIKLTNGISQDQMMEIVQSIR